MNDTVERKASSRRLAVGPTGSGRTTWLQERYRELLADGVSSSTVLVLVAHAARVGEWRDTLGEPAAAGLSIYTFNGWAQRELRRHWPRLGRGGPEPHFLTADVAQFLMERRVRQALERGELAELTATPQRTALLLEGNLGVIAAAAGVPPEELPARMAGGVGAKESSVFVQAAALLEGYHAALSQAQVLDYGLCLALYRELLRDPAYGEFLAGELRYILVDDLDETLPLAQELIELLMGRLEGGFLTYNTDGGHTRFQGADPEGAWRRFAPLCAQVPLEGCRTATPQLAEFGQALFRRLMGEEVTRLFPLEDIRTEFRGEMLRQVVETLRRELAAGAVPGELAVVAPAVDPVLEHTIAGGLAREGVGLINLTRSRRLRDEPYALALVSLLLLANPAWGLAPSVGELTHTFRLLLDLDPVRGFLLGRAVVGSFPGALPDLAERGLLPRVGFAKGEAYRRVAEWLTARRAEELPVDVFCHRAFGELLAPLEPAQDHRVYCRQVIQSAARFRSVAQVLPELGGAPVGRQFAELVRGGTVAAEPLIARPEDDRRVLLATPYAYLAAGAVSRVQVWVDLDAAQWLRGDAKELVNPRTCTPARPADLAWTDAEEEAVRLENAARTVRALARRCTDRLIVAGSLLDSRGFEQDGELAEALQEVAG